MYNQLSPLHEQTNKCDCSSSVWWCWFEMNWNFCILEESAHCWKPQLQVLILFCWFYSCSQNLQEFWIIIYFRLGNLKSSNVHEWICLRMGFYGFAHRNRSIFQEQPFWPQKTSFSQFLAAASPGWVVLLKFGEVFYLIFSVFCMFGYLYGTESVHAGSA